MGKTMTRNVKAASAAIVLGLGLLGAPSQSFADPVLSGAPTTRSVPTGGAPSPEVDAMLGLALAGGTVVFLHHRKNGKSKSAA